MIHEHQHFDFLGKIILERVVFTPPLRLMEKLDSEACLLYPISGNSTVYDNDTKYALTSENGILMKCGSYFNHWHINNDDSKNEVVGIHLYPELIQSIYTNHLPEFLTSSTTTPTHSQLIESSQILKPYIEGLMLYFKNPQIVDEEIILLKVKELLILLYKFNSNNIRQLLHDLFNPIEIDFKKTINANIFEDLSIEELAHLTNNSLSSFKRKFKELFDDSPASYIKKKRLERAASLLKVSNDRIIDICFESGFNNLDNFSKSFKKAYGFTPSEFRMNSLS